MARASGQDTSPDSLLSPSLQTLGLEAIGSMGPRSGGPEQGAPEWLRLKVKIALPRPWRTEVRDGGQQAGPPRGLCPRGRGPAQAGEPAGDDLRAGGVRWKWLLPVRVLHGGLTRKLSRLSRLF